MKTKLIRSLIAGSIIVLAASCGTTTSVVEQTPEPVPEKKVGTAREIKVITSTSSEVKNIETPESKYAKKIAGLSLTVLSSPKETVNGKSFSQPFVFKAVKADGTPAEGIEISISYPDTKIESSVSFGLITLSTDSEGTVTFVPATPAYSFDSIISAYPAGDVTNAKIAELAAKASVTAPYKVKTNMTYAGGTIAIVDFSAAGKPITNNSVTSSNILMSLMRLGFKRVGNADFTNDILKEDSSAVYKTAKNLLGNNSAYLVYGTVKYAAPVEQTADGKYSLTLDGKIVCLNMKDGSILYTAEKSETAVADKEWNCLPEARKALAEYFANSINYGL